MRISYTWLQEYFEEKLPSPEKLAELLTMHAFEIDSVVNDILDVKVMPDRAHDCLSYWGIAKEVGTLTGLEVKPMIFPVEGDEAVKTSGLIKLKVETNPSTVLGASCRRAMKRVAIGVEIGPSPDWLKQRLESVGQRSINNIVDIANFVMLETGQPVHTFDLDKLHADQRGSEGGSTLITIRNAKKGEKVKTLDGKEFTLDESMLVIADDEKALDIAGVKGGANSGIDENTTNILLSACNFEPVNIRQTSKKLGLRTDASERFEKEISPVLTEIAMNYLSFLIKEIAGGYLAADVLDFYPHKAVAPKISISKDDIERLLGIKIKEKEIEEIFTKLRFEYKKPGFEGSPKPGFYEVTPPIERLDINMKEDIVEEIGRIYGYEKIKAILPPEFSKSGFKGSPKPDFWSLIQQARRQLLAEGYSEVYTYTFQNKGQVELANPIAEDKKYLRANLSDGLKECINLNIKNLPLLDADEVKVFEIGTVFSAGKTPGVKDAPTPDVEEVIHVAFGDKKEVKEMTLNEYTKNLPNLVLTTNYSLLTNIKYKPISIYPFILRDIAVWVESPIDADQKQINADEEKLKSIIIKNAGELLAREPKLFDKFSKEGKTSYAFKLVFQSSEKTLSDEEINGTMNSINKAVEKNGWQVR